MAGGGRRVVVVVGAGAANLKSTVALNLAAAVAAGGRAVRLVDGDGASGRALRRALAGGPGAETGIDGASLHGPSTGERADAWTARLPWAAAPVAVVDHPGLVSLARLHGAPQDGSAAPVTIVDPPPRLDGPVRAALDAADMVLVPVDASSLALRVLGEVEAALAGRGGALCVALARRLPRSADRWALVERLEGLAPGVLLPVTLPMARATAGRRDALLYAPGTRAARAYAALARALALVDAPESPTATPRGTTP